MGNIKSTVCNSIPYKQEVTTFVSSSYYYTCDKLTKLNNEITNLFFSVETEENIEKLKDIQEKLEQKLKQKEEIDILLKNKDLDDLTKEELVKYIQSHDFVKLDINNENFNKTLKDLQVMSDELLPIEIEMYKKLREKIGLIDYTQEQANKKYSFTLKKFVKPKFTKDEYIKVSTNNVNTQLEVPNLSINYEIPKPEKPCIYKPFTLEEFNDGFRENKSTIDMMSISKQFLINSSDFIKYKLINGYNTAFTDKKTIQKYSIGCGSFIYKKKGLTNNVKSFRQIVSIPITVNHFHRLMALRLTDHMISNKYLDTTIQKGGVSNLSNPLFQQILKLKNTIKYANKNKKECCILFIDIADAFPSLKIDRICEVLKKYHVDEQYIEYIKNFYSNFSYYVGTKEWKTDMNKWERGLLQGCPLSPFLFVTTFNYILRFLEAKYLDNSAFDMGQKILFLAYIDDVAIITKDFDSMFKIYSEFKELCAELGLKINIDKTKYMHINMPDKFEANKEFTINKVDKYKYLGETVYANGKSDNSFFAFYYEVKRRLQFLDNTKLEKDQKLDVIKKLLIPAIQKKFTVLYDVSLQEKKKIIKLLNTSMVKWGIDTNLEINLVPDIKGLIKDTTDKILKNTDIEEEPYLIKENQDQNTINIKDVKFNYANAKVKAEDEDSDNESDDD
jgi:hypothetical protein